MARNRTTSFTFLFGICLTLFLTGCNLTDTNENSVVPEPGFTYEITDENGATIGKVSDRQVDEIDVETGVGLFGNEFLPTEMLDRISERFGIAPELFKRNEIILHAESGVEQDIHFASLRFKFPAAEPLNPGSYQIFSLNEEQLLQTLRNFWDFGRNHRPFNNFKMLRNTASKQNLMTSDTVFANYFEFGFGLQNNQYVYFSKGGTVDIESVTDERVNGSFSLELTGIPVLIFELDEFPDEPELRSIRIIGDFTAEPGDFEDLKQLRFNLLSDFELPFIPLF